MLHDIGYEPDKNLIDRRFRVEGIFRADRADRVDILYPNALKGYLLISTLSA
jgi:hypothetical protein